jgi:hypothetical protein
MSMARILLVLVYPLLILARIADAVSRRDSMQRRRPPAGSLWITRTQVPSDLDYFSEESPADAGSGRLAAVVLSWMARFYAPPREQPLDKVPAKTDREQGIPDEMYTLW